MKNANLSLAVFVLMTGALLMQARDAAAQADPIALVVNRNSDGVDVIDVNAAMGLPAVNTGLGGRPTDIVYDERSGQVFISQKGEVVRFNARLPDGHDLTSITASGEGSNIALDPVGRRIFVSTRAATDEQTDGLVHEISIANLANPVVTQRIVPGIPDLRFITWDAKNRRVYVIEDGGRVARTDNGGWNWTRIGGVGVQNPGGILADPNGGMWATGRSPARLMRFFTADNFATYTMPAATTPRGLNFDPADPGSILIAVEDIARIRKYSIPTNTFANTMSTGLLPQDVVKTNNGWLVSANRINNMMPVPGSASINVPGNLAINTNRTVPVNIVPISMAAVDVPRLFANPSTGNYCYRRTGDTSTKTFTVQNTRVNRASMDLRTVTVGGLNPANYVLTGANTCNAARLAWGASCTFSLRFTANPPSNQPAPPFGPPPIAYWPAQVSITSTDGSASTTIGLRADLAFGTCFSLGL